MRKDLDDALVRDFPLTFRDRNGGTRVTCMCWGFPGDGWEPLIRRGQYQFNVNCAVCHGTSGRGGTADAAYGIVGAYNLSVAPSNLHADDLRSQPDGQLFNTITGGVRNMPAYAHQVGVQDRWAVIAYLRVLQYAHQPPAAK